MPWPLYPRYALDRRLKVCRNCLDAVAKRKILCPQKNNIPLTFLYFFFSCNVVVVVVVM
jgi:hypothetical protein